tara:strand:+ start:3362 stop:3868 length:507 start_codon:yes stop_codon:yes gene_type:complete
MSKFDDSMTEALNLPPEPETKISKLPDGKVVVKEVPEKNEVEVLPPSGDRALTLPPATHDKRTGHADSDYGTARENIHHIVQQGTAVLEDLLAVSRESESPRAYEVAGNFMKILVEANKDLLDLHQTIKDIEKDPEGTSQPDMGTKIEKAVFVGSTADLQRMLGEKDG